MFNTIGLENKIIIRNRKTVYPKRVNVENVTIDDLWDEVDFMKDTHKAIYITTYEGGKIQAIIHKSITSSILSGYTYYLWWDRTDKHHDRYLEILDFEMISKI